MWYFATIPKNTYEDADIEYLEKIRKISLYLVCICMFLDSINFTACLPSIWPYLLAMDKDATIDQSGYAISVYSTGQFLFSPVVGYLSQKIHLPPRVFQRMPTYTTTHKRGLSVLLHICFVGQIAGCYLYSSCFDFPEYLRVEVLLVSRFVIGVFVSGSALYRGYVASACRDDELVFFTTLITVAQSVGFILGPGLQYFLAGLGNPGPIELPWFRFNTFTAIGHVTILICIVEIVICVLWFAEIYPHDIDLLKKYLKKTGGQVAALDNKENKEKGAAPAKINIAEMEEEQELTSLDNVLLYLILTAALVQIANFCAFESLSTTLFTDYIGVSGVYVQKMSSGLMSVGGTLTILIMFETTKIMTDYGCEKLLIFSFALTLLYSLSMIPIMGSMPMHPDSLLNSTITKWGYPPDLAYVVKCGTNTEELVLIPIEEWKVTNTPCPNKEIGGCNINKLSWCYSSYGLTMYQILFSSLIFLIGYPAGFLIVYTAITKQVADRNSSLWMGILTSVGSLGRSIVPMMITMTYRYGGNNLSFGILAIVNIGGVICVVIACIRAKWSLVPVAKKIKEEEKKKKEEEAAKAKAAKNPSQPAIKKEGSDN